MYCTWERKVYTKSGSKFHYHHFVEFERSGPEDVPVGLNNVVMCDCGIGDAAAKRAAQIRDALNAFLVNPIA